MKVFAACIVLCFIAAAQTPEVYGVTSTQALLYYAAPDDSPCLIQVSESSSFSPPVADLDPALFPRANLDSERNILPPGTGRLVRIGLRTSAKASDGKWHSRALAAETQHYVQVSCGASSGATTFATATPRGFAPEPLPTHPGAWGNLAYPEFDFTSPAKPVIDPRTGVKIYTADPKAWSMSNTLAIPANWYGGGSGWTNAANITSYKSAVAATSNTDPIVLYFDAAKFSDQLRISGGYWPYDDFLDLGVDLYGSGTSAGAPNRTIQLALSLDSGQTPYTSWVDAALPLGADAAAGTFPSTYPQAYFGGWKQVLPRNAWPKRGFVTVADGLVTLTQNDIKLAIGAGPADVNSYFVQDWVEGTKIWINNSAPACANNFCTIDSVQSAVQLTLSESLTIGESEYRSAALAVMVRKANPVGTVKLSAQLRIAKGYPHNIWSGGCASKTVTSVDGIVGYPCVLPHVRQEAGGLYFIGVSQPAVRLVSLFVNPDTLPGHTAADSTNGALRLLGPTVQSFDPNDPTIVYAALNTNGGAIGLFKIRYTGDWRPLDIAYQSSSANPPATRELTWTNMTKSAERRDLRTQILANTTYDEARSGALKSLQAVGVSGKYAAFESLYGQESVCWIFTFDSTTGNFYRAWRTDDGSSLPGLKYAGCHAVLPLDGGALFLSTNGLRWRNSAIPFGGPFSAPVAAVQRNGAFDRANTALPWPPAGASEPNGYDTACPADLRREWIDGGAVGNQCVTIQTKEPCSAFATAGEKTLSPCPWDTNMSMVAALGEGDFLKPSGQWDREGFRVVRKTTVGAGIIQLVLQRNANYSYCALGKDGVDTPAEMIQPNGWTFDAVPPEACFTAGILIDIERNLAYVVNQNMMRGHFDASSAGPGANTWIAAGNFLQSQPIYSIEYNRAWADVWKKMDHSVASAPPFAGYNSIHDIQSYIDAKQSAATAELRRYAFDFRHYNGPLGRDIEHPSQVIGDPTNAALQEDTDAVYKLSYTGVADAKRGVMNVWAGEKVLIEKSSPELGNTLTDADLWRFCYAYRAGECRSGSNAGDLYAVIPGADLKSACWASQVNLRVPCAMAGPVQAMRAMQVRIDAPDDHATGQRILSSLLMGPGQQYVYSNILPTPDGSYLLFGGYLTSGYHTGLMAMKLPSFPPDDSVPKPVSYVPVYVKGEGASVYVEFGYEEFGKRTDFYCTPRQEACRVSAAVIDETKPFSFAHEPLPSANGSSTIAIPAVPGRLVYYRVVDGERKGPLQAAIPQPEESNLSPDARRRR
jgi:hypothetical protein